jgi:hypothetical protein
MYRHLAKVTQAFAKSASSFAIAAIAPAQSPIRGCRNNFAVGTKGYRLGRATSASPARCLD